ncbi:hypothetical protein V6N13_123960 [Hibiscus sabdariffa]
MVCFVEPRISGCRAYVVISTLGFSHSHRVEAWLLRRDLGGLQYMRALWLLIEICYGLNYVIFQQLLDPLGYFSVISMRRSSSLIDWVVHTPPNPVVLFKILSLTMACGIWGIKGLLTHGLEVPLQSIWIDSYAIPIMMRLFPNPLFNISYDCIQITGQCFLLLAIRFVTVDHFHSVTFLAGNLTLISRAWRAICRKQKSKIIALKISNGSWCEDVATLMSEVVQFSQNLFKDDGSPSEAFFITSSFPHLSNDALQYLDSIPLCEEIHSALMEMASLKSPGLGWVAC